MQVLIIALLAQLLFTTSDVLARRFMGGKNFNLQAFVHPWFLMYIAVRIFATFGQLYVFSQLELGKTLLIFTMTSLILANIIGLLYFNELISINGYIAIVLAVLAILVVLIK